MHLPLLVAIVVPVVALPLGLADLLVLHVRLGDWVWDLLGDWVLLLFLLCGIC